MPAQFPYMLASAPPTFYNAKPTEYGPGPFTTPLMAPVTPAFYAAASPQVTYQTIQAPIQQYQTIQAPFQTIQTPVPARQTIFVPQRTMQMIPKAQSGPSPNFVVKKHQPIVHSL
jgi:hypothetical protein